jgi:membrane protein
MGWAASSVFGAVRRSLNIASSVEIHRPWVPQKLLDLSMVLFFAPFFLASIAATTALRAAEVRSGEIPILGPIADDLGTFWWLASIFLPWVFSLMLFTFLYALIPVTRPKLRYVIPGAIIAALAFEFAKLGFSLYLEYFSNYDVVFGSLGAVVAFMFWVYVSAGIMLYGAELIASLPKELDRISQPSLGGGVQVSLGTKVTRILKGLVVSQKT